MKSVVIVMSCLAIFTVKPKVSFSEEIDQNGITVAQQDKSEFFQQGLKHDRLNNHQAAILNYSKAIKLDSKYTDAYINRAISKFKLKKRNLFFICFNEIN